MTKAADGRYDLVKTKVCEVEDTSLTKTQIRAAILAAGVKCPRGTEVYADKVGRVQYQFTTEALKSIAEARVELPLED